MAAPAPSGLGAGSTLAVVSGEDLSPVPGAHVTVAGREYAADGAGQLVLGEAAAFGALVDVVAPGFLDRQTSLRSARDTRFILWPKTTETGITESFTAQIAYTWGTSDPPAFGSSPLERLAEGTSTAAVWISPEILANDHTHVVHEQAVDELNTWVGGHVRYVLADTRPATGVVFEARVDPADEDCDGRTRAFFAGDWNARGEIIGGEIVYCTERIARTLATVTHELGHTVGLQHSYDGDRDLMTPYFTLGRRSRFSDREAVVMNLLFERPAGNRFPDSDREARTGARRRSRIVCR